MAFLELFTWDWILCMSHSSVIKDCVVSEKTIGLFTMTYIFILSSGFINIYLIRFLTTILFNILKKKKAQKKPKKKQQQTENKTILKNKTTNT